MLNLPNPYNDELCGSEQLFNSNSEPCEPCTPETKQVRWADIIDKPVCFPTCTPEVLGVTSLNGFAGNITLGIGSTGTDFNIVSSSGTITLNLPTANATKTGKLSSTDWNTFNNKQNPITLTTTGNSGVATFIGNVLNIPNYTLAGLGGVAGTGTINYLAKWTFTTSTSLTNSIVYDNGTQVGIGTFAPTARLDIVTASTTTSSIKARNSNGATILSNTSAIGSLSTDWNAPLAFSTNSVERLRILTNGNVGIGTTNPTELLHVDGGSSLKNILLKTTASGLASSGYLYENGNGTIKLGGFNASLGAGTTSAYGFNLFYNSTAVLTVDAAKIGINNTIPTSTLDVIGTASISSNLNVNSGTLFVNATNNNVGIGTSTPTSVAKLEIIGNGSTSSTFGLSILPLSGSPYILARNDGKTLIRNSTGNIYSLGSTSDERTLTASQGTGLAEVTYPFRLANSYVIGGSGVGLGVGMEFNGSDYTDVFASIYSVATSYTGVGNSVNDLVFNTKNGSGAVAERFRVKASGELRAQGAVTAGNASLSASAILQADSTTRGFLPPRMTTTQINAITTPATGLVVYNTTIDHLCVYQGAVTGWVKLSHTPM